MRVAASSGDLLADRRLAYAAETLRDGDPDGAADLLGQVLERTPAWVPALLLLGEAEERRGRREAARAAYARAATHDAGGTFGASLHAARLGGEVPDAMPAPYVAALFDQYAPRFDAHLTGALGYRGPALLADALARTHGRRRFARALDLGCGTGLMGEALRDRVDHLEGVDLSRAMVEASRRRGCYDALHVGDAALHLRAAPAGGFDLVVAADVLVYLGALAPLFAAAARALAPDGVLAATAQTHAGEGVTLGDDLRYAHSAAVLGSALEGAGLAVEILEHASTRRERGADVPGLLAVARKP